jgi:hypothetical protein
MTIGQSKIKVKIFLICFWGKTSFLLLQILAIFSNNGNPFLNFENKISGALVDHFKEP